MRTIRNARAGLALAAIAVACGAAAGPLDPPAPPSGQQNCTTTRQPILFGLYEVEHQNCVGLDDEPHPR